MHEPLRRTFFTRAPAMQNRSKQLLRLCRQAHGIPWHSNPEIGSFRDDVYAQNWRLAHVAADCFVRSLMHLPNALRDLGRGLTKMSGVWCHQRRRIMGFVRTINKLPKLPSTATLGDVAHLSEVAQVRQVALQRHS